MLMIRLLVLMPGVLLVTGASPREATAGTIAGKLDLPPAPEHPPSPRRGFLERVENQILPARRASLGSSMVVALSPEAGGAASAPGQVTYQLVGESFARPVIAARVGAEVVIKNVSGTARTLVAAEDAKLLPADPINPTGTKSFRAAEAKTYTIRDATAPHLQGTIVVVDAAFVASVDDAGRFTIDDVPEGAYTLRVFFKDAWLDGSTAVTVGKGKTEVNPKLPALPPSSK